MAQKWKISYFHYQMKLNLKISEINNKTIDNGMEMILYLISEAN